MIFCGRRFMPRRNMHGWRKDPVNNPPRIRIDFHAYSNGAFKD